MADFHNFDRQGARGAQDARSTRLKAKLIDGSVTADAFSGQPPASAAP